eukprot:CAMPEP_0117676162 /NCGR_PEP_ID=MMETSP0804-20121206/16005_1 /TAXON_ID=1074897 /ORGANISM="Tetraselmis astigmatica, Strain CCMP880" /LENGTH=70 /DNA_ID=CAMNT_0005485241 /DNA_START=17 /DNA_END=227 /DNA_ORIENTATION=-
MEGDVSRNCQSGTWEGYLFGGLQKELQSCFSKSAAQLTAYAAPPMPVGTYLHLWPPAGAAVGLCPHLLEA